MNFRRYDEIRTKFAVGATPAGILFLLWAFTPIGKMFSDLTFVIMLMLLFIGGIGWSLLFFGKKRD